MAHCSLCCFLLALIIIKSTLKYSSVNIVSTSLKLRFSIHSISLLFWFRNCVLDLLRLKSFKCRYMSLNVWVFLNQCNAPGNIPVWRKDSGSTINPGWPTTFFTENLKTDTRDSSIEFLLLFVYNLSFPYQLLFLSTLFMGINENL